MSSHLHAIVKKQASEEEQTAVAEGVIEEMASFDQWCTFQLAIFYSQPWIFFLQLRCPFVFESSEHHVLLSLGIQDTLLWKVLKKCATLNQQAKTHKTQV